MTNEAWKKRLRSMGQRTSNPYSSQTHLFRTFMVAKPMSQPLMTCCFPITNLNGWPRSRELSNLLPSFCVRLLAVRRGGVGAYIGWTRIQLAADAIMLVCAPKSGCLVLWRPDWSWTID